MKTLWSKIRNEWRHPEEREIVFPTILALEVLTWFFGPIIRWKIHGNDTERMQDPTFLAQSVEASLVLIMAVILFASGWAYSRSQSFTRVIAVLFLISVGMIAFNLLFLERHGSAVAYVPLIPLLFLACYSLLRYLMAAKSVSVGTLSGAVLCYLLLAMMFTQLYFLAWLIQPDLLSGVPLWTESSGMTQMDFVLEKNLLNQFQYFSMTTFTTLGYGDITPNTAIARSLATGEAAVGQIYVGIIIAKLVSLYMREAGNTRTDREE